MSRDVHEMAQTEAFLEQMTGEILLELLAGDGLAVANEKMVGEENDIPYNT